MNSFFISNNFNHSSNKKISMMVVVRCSLEALEQTIDNIFTTCNNPDDIEMLIRMDDDDLVVGEIVNSNIFHKYNVKLYTGYRYEYAGMNEYYNELISMSTGDILFHWGDDVDIKTQGWDDKLSSHIGEIKVLQNLIYYNSSIGLRACPDINFSPVITRVLYDILGVYSPCALSDCYYDYIGEVAGIKEMSGIDVLVTRELMNDGGIPAWRSFSDDDNMNKILEDSTKVISYLDGHNISRRKIPYFVISFNPIAKLEIRGGVFHRDYLVEFIDNENTVFNISFPTYNWASCNISDYTPWLIRVTNNNGEVIFKHHFDLSGKKVMIEMGGNNTEELLCWLPFIEQFRNKYNCEIVCLTFYPELFGDIYDGIKFVDVKTYRREDPEIYAFYKLESGMDNMQIIRRLGLGQ